VTEDDVAKSAHALEIMQRRGLGDLADRMGIELKELSAEKAVATMPVSGNTQPLGVLHGGAHAVLGESLGSFAANVHAHPWGYAVGIEINATHHSSATEGVVTGTCTAVKLGRSLTSHEIKVTDEAGKLLSTIRITNFLRANKS
jgi:1,4-dihydroxy-2-naphthoyl-CoA hydrolase|tara:strand:+ start:1520 stop:1951 length:432 start_codon:yes stop_codon:yes gene_type:complete